MKSILFLRPLILGVFLMVGCGKSDTKPTVAVDKNNNSSGNPITAPVDYLGAASKAKPLATKVVDVSTLNRAIQAYHAGEDRFPKDLNELVKDGYMPKIPALPTGMRYLYDPRTGALQVAK